MQEIILKPTSTWVPPQSFPDLSEAKEIAVDCETCDPNIRTRGPGGVRGDGFVVGISIATDTGYKGYFPFAHQGGGNLDKGMVIRWAKNLLKNENQEKIFTNCGYDLEWLATLGVEIKGKIHDIQLAGPLLDEERESYSLQCLCLDYGVSGKNEELRFKDGKVNREMAGMIADQVNHATGIVHMPFREWSSLAFFAPRLEASRWSWMIGDPAKAANTFKGWKNASAEDRAFATAEVKQKATVVGVYLGLLGINQAMLSMTGSEDKVNLTNPRKGDWLAFKVAGHNVGIAGPMLGMVRLFVNLIHDSVGDRSKFESLRDRGSEMGATVLQYGRGKLSPMAGFGMDIATQETAMKDVVPWSEDKPEKGKKTLSGGEYGMETFLPIPFEEAVKEVWTDQGMSAEQQNLWLNLLKGAAVVIGAGGTGARISSEAKPAEPAPEKNPFPIRGIPKFKKYSQGDIINRNNKNYTVTGFDTDGEPLVEEV